MLEKKTIIDSVNIREHEQLEVRRADLILEDGVEVARTYHRHVLAPGDPVDNEDTKVAAIASFLWTSEVVAAYSKFLESNNNKGGE